MDSAASCTGIPSDWRNGWTALKCVLCERGKSEKSVSCLQEPEQPAYHPQAFPQAASSRFVCINPAAACPGILNSLRLVKAGTQGGISMVLPRIGLVCLFPAGRPTTILQHTGPGEATGRAMARRQPQRHHTSLAHPTCIHMARRHRRCHHISLGGTAVGLRASTRSQPQRHHTRPAGMTCRPRSRSERHHIVLAALRPGAQRQHQRQCTRLSECLTGSNSSTGLRVCQSCPPLVCSAMRQSHPAADGTRCRLS